MNAQDVVLGIVVIMGAIGWCVLAYRWWLATRGRY